MMTIAIGADNAATEMKNIIKTYLQQQGFRVPDYSYDVDGNEQMYPDIAYHLALAIREGKYERGILLCGTGIGMAITANKVPGVRAALCHDAYSAERARKSNNAQIMTLGARVIAPELAKTLLNIWLHAEFEGGGSAAKVERINYYDKQTQ